MHLALGSHPPGSARKHMGIAKQSYANPLSRRTRRRAMAKGRSGLFGRIMSKW